MNIMSVDLEMNQPSGSVIQVGAVITKARTGELLDTFNTYVHTIEVMNPDIITLTGITQAHVDSAPSVFQAYKMLEEFHKKHKCFMNPLVWGSGRSNDSLVLYDQAKCFLDVGEQNFMGFRVVDVKCLFQSLAMVKNVGVRAGVEKTCKKFHIGFDPVYGPPHNALADAWNTARLWHHMMNQFATTFTQTLHIKEGTQK